MCACEAPRKNPLDPQNPDSPFGIIEGLLVNNTSDRLENVTVSWRKGSLSVKSDQEGRFYIGNIPLTAGYLRYERSDYHADSTWVEWGSSQKHSLFQILDKIPTLQNLQMFSSVINKHPAEQEFQVTISAEISDMDSEIESVTWQVPALAESGLLDEAGDDVFHSTFQPDLPNEAIVGNDIVLIVKNEGGRETEVGRSVIRRVIKQSVDGVSPASGEITGCRPQFVWQRFSPVFEFTYRLEVYREVPFDEPVLVRTISDLSPDLTTVQVQSNLPAPGSHFWVIWVVDNFNNQARSRPLTFEVRDVVQEFSSMEASP